MTYPSRDGHDPYAPGNQPARPTNPYGQGPEPDPAGYGAKSKDNQTGKVLLIGCGCGLILVLLFVAAIVAGIARGAIEWTSTEDGGAESAAAGADLFPDGRLCPGDFDADVYAMNTRTSCQRALDITDMLSTNMEYGDSVVSLNDPDMICALIDGAYPGYWECTGEGYAVNVVPWFDDGEYLEGA